MKKFRLKTFRIKTALFISFLLLGASASFAQDHYGNETDTFNNTDEYADSVASMEMFRQQLSTNGEWIKVDTSEIDAEAVAADPSNPSVYNDGLDDNLNREIIWRPNGVDAEWSPYQYGCWKYTSCGWMWISYYNWGYCTSHYGRWWFSSRYGWVWSPGYVWAPAWVSWCYYDDCIGWYPLSPRERCHHDRHRHHRDYTSVTHVTYVHQHWTFVQKKDFTATINKKTVINPTKYPTFVGGNTIVNDINIDKGKVKNIGPNIDDIEKSAGKKIEQVNVDKLAEGNTKIYKTEEKNVGVKVDDGRKTEEKKKYDDGTINDQQKQTQEKKTEAKKVGEKKRDDGIKQNDGEKKKEEYKPKDEYKQPERKHEINNNDGNRGTHERTKEKAPPPKEKNDDGNKNKDNGNNDNGKKGR